MQEPSVSERPIPRGAFLSRPWLVAGLSLGAAACLCLVLWSPWEGASSGTRSLKLYCAAGLAKPVRALLEQYEAETGIKVEASFGPTGSMLSAIRAAKGQGDLFLSADHIHIEEAKEHGLIAEIFTLGMQRPVLAANHATFTQLQTSGKPITCLKDLLRKDIKIVLANPDVAAVGILSKNALKAHGLWKEIEADPRLATVGTVNETATAIAAKIGTVGIVWAANAKQSDLVVLPIKELETYQEPIELAVVKKTKGPAAALSLARFLAAPDRGGAAFVKHGYEPAEGDRWDPKPALRIDAGAMLKPALEPVIRDFEAREGVKVETFYAGCGVLVSKMKGIKSGKGGRFPDAYFACEVSFLEQVQDWFDAGTLISENDVVLVVRKEKENEVRDLADLAKSYLRVGLADPEKSALGALTDTILTRLDLKDRIERDDRKYNVVYVPEGHMLVAQLRARALDAAVVYRSNVKSSPGALEDLTIVSGKDPHAIARQPFAIARDTPHRRLLERFRDRLVAPESAARFRAVGFHWAAKR